MTNFTVEFHKQTSIHNDEYADGFGCLVVPNQRISSYEDLAHVLGISLDEDQLAQHDSHVVSGVVRALKDHGFIFVPRDCVSEDLANEIIQSSERLLGFQGLLPNPLARVFHAHAVDEQFLWNSLHFLYSETETGALFITRGGVEKVYAEVGRQRGAIEEESSLIVRSIRLYFENISGEFDWSEDHFHLLKERYEQLAIDRDVSRDKDVLDYFRMAQEVAFDLGEVFRVDLEENIATSFAHNTFHAFDARQTRNRMERSVFRECLRYVSDAIEQAS